PKTITSAEKFIKALGATRQRGCAIEDEESEIGMVCIAAPIRDDSGDVVAAVGIAGPQTRRSKKTIAAGMPHVIATAGLVSLGVGYCGREHAEISGVPPARGAVSRPTPSTPPAPL